MNPNNGYNGPWPPGQPPNTRRFLPVAGGFSDAPPRPLPHHGRPQYPVQYPIQPTFPSQQAYPHPPPFQHPQYHQPPPRSPFIPLIPLSAVEDLQEEEPPVPFTSGGFHDPFNRAYATSGPAVYEGFIPAPGNEDEDEYPDNMAGYRGRNLDSSDSEFDDWERMMEEEAERDALLQIEQKDDSEVDADYSEEEAQNDAGSAEEMELEVEFEDEEERVRPKRGRGTTRGAPKTRATPNIIRGSSTRGRGRGRGGKRGRPSTRGRGGHTGSASTRGRKKGGKAGKVNGGPGSRGPRSIADPGHEWKSLQQQANKHFIEKDYEIALEYAQQAIQLNPEIFDAYNIASEIYAAMGREQDSISVLLAGAPTKRDPGLWQLIIDRINKLDPELHPQFSEENKAAAILPCLNAIILLTNDYETRSLKLELLAQQGKATLCVKLGLKMLKTRQELGEDPDTSVLKIMAMMGTSTAKQTKLHLRDLIDSFEEAINVYTEPHRDPQNNELDWEMINIYLDLLDRAGRYSIGITRLKYLARWKQGRVVESFWDGQEDDREFDIQNEPRRITVPEFEQSLQDPKNTKDASYGSTLPLEIRVKLGLFRLRKSKEDFTEAMVSRTTEYGNDFTDFISTTLRCWNQMNMVKMP
jgi:general transcription factor 3C polypeptide 3 (transcription factor C subunit 4)